MKQNIPTALFAVCALFLSFCQHEKSEILNTETGNEANIPWQECVEFSNYDLTICFLNASEYRCPCDVECVWEGSVDFTFRATGPDLDSTFTLTASTNRLDLLRSITLGNVIINAEDASGITCADYGNYENYKAKVILTEE